MIIYIDHELEKIKIPQKYELFLDDERFPKDVIWIDLPLYDWVIVRNYKEFVDCIKKYNIPSVCSFDHDLSDSSYKEYHRSMASDKSINYNNIKEKTGYHCAKWLANYCVDNNIPVPVYYIHTLNGPGGANIISMLESARKAMML